MAFKENTVILDIGEKNYWKNDAMAWAAGCKKHEIGVKKEVIKHVPSVSDLVDFFSSKEPIVFIGGHSWCDSKGNWYLANHQHCNNQIAIYFFKDSVKIYKKGRLQVVLHKEKRIQSGRFKGKRFNLHKAKDPFLIWVGCRSGYSRHNVETLRQLFGSPFILGFTELSDSQYVTYLLTGSHKWSKGGFHSKSFFSQYSRSKVRTDLQLKDLWLRLAYELFNDHSIDPHFTKYFVREGKQVWKKFAVVDRSGTCYTVDKARRASGNSFRISIGYKASKRWTGGWLAERCN